MAEQEPLLLHGYRVDASSLDEATRQEVIRRIAEIDQIDVVRSVVVGPDVFDNESIVVVAVLDGLDVLDHYRRDPVHEALEEYLRPMGLPSVSLNVQFQPSS